MNHFIKRCIKCKTVMAQCRCPGPKEEQWGICEECLEDAGGPGPETPKEELPVIPETVLEAGETVVVTLADRVERLEARLGDAEKKLDLIMPEVS